MKRRMLFAVAFAATIGIAPAQNIVPRVSAPNATATPPAPTTPRQARLPVPSERTLQNGLRVVSLPMPGTSLVAARLIVAGGSSEAPPGLAALTASLLTQGTRGRSAADIATAADSLGAQLNAGATIDSLLVDVNATKARFANAMELLADVTLHPAFAADEVARAKRRFVSGITLSANDPATLATLVAYRAMYSDGRGQPLNGTVKTVQTVTDADVAAFYTRVARPNRAILVIGGDITSDAAFELASQRFGAWERSGASHRAMTTAPIVARLQHDRLIVVDQPEAGRTAIVVATPTLQRASANFPAAVAATSVLSGFSGRLNSEIRVKRGLSYGANARLAAQETQSPFVASTLVEHTKASEAEQLMVSTIRELAGAEVPANELSSSELSYVGAYGRSVETVAGAVAEIGAFARYGIPLSSFDTYGETIRTVSSTSVQRFASEDFRRGFTVVLVGNASAFLPELKKRYPDALVIPALSLDLGSPAMVVTK